MCAVLAGMASCLLDGTPMSTPAVCMLRDREAGRRSPSARRIHLQWRVDDVECVHEEEWRGGVVRRNDLKRVVGEDILLVGSPLEAVCRSAVFPEVGILVATHVYRASRSEGEALVPIVIAMVELRVREQSPNPWGHFREQHVERWAADTAALLRCSLEEWPRRASTRAARLGAHGRTEHHVWFWHMGRAAGVKLAVWTRT